MTEAQTAADLAVAATGLRDVAGVPSIILPDGYHAQQFEALLPRPVRPRGQYVAQDQASFRSLVEQMRDNPALEPVAGPMPQRPRTYVDKVKRTVLCVLNDTEAGRPGHRDWSVFWKVERSLAWGAWVGLAKGNYVSQKVLAEFLEDWRHTVVAPDAATLMELATDMQGHKGAEWRSGQRLKDGTIQVSYVEEVRATNREGVIEVPGALTIFVPVFDGEPPIEIQARLRWSVDDGKVTFRVVLPPIEEVEQGQMIVIGNRLVEWAATPLVFGAPA